MLIHNTQVSPDLLTCADYCISYGQLCSDVPVHQTKEPLSGDQVLLNISNFSKELTKKDFKNHLNLMTNNTGGKIVNSDYENSFAIVSFKSKNDAQRCQQRVNNYKLFGSTLKTVMFDQKNSIQTGKISTNINPSVGFKNKQPTSKSISFWDLLKANTCKQCSPNYNSRSKNSNFLFNNSNMFLHISLENLTTKLKVLLDSHNGRLPLNALPDCWLQFFGEEMDSETKPKVLTEHLIRCVSGVTTDSVPVQFEHHQISVKFIIFQHLKENGSFVQLSNRKMKKLKEVSNNIRALLLDNNETFPSILSSQLESKYLTKFNQELPLSQFEVPNVSGLISLMSNRFNLYSFQQDELISLNFNEQLYRFATDLNSLYQLAPKNQSSEDLFSLFQQYYKKELNLEMYGVCFVNDLIEPMLKQHSDKINGTSSTALEKWKFSKWKLPLLSLLNNLPECCVTIDQMHSVFSPIMKTKLSLPTDITLTQFVAVLKTIDSGTFEVCQVESVDYLTLAPKFRKIHLGKQVFSVFEKTLRISHGIHHQCDCILSMSIYELYSKCILTYHTLHSTLLHKASSLVKLIEENIFLYSNVHRDYALIFKDHDAFLQTTNVEWINKQKLLLFMIMRQLGANQVMNALHLKQTFHNAYGYSFGTSLLLKHAFRNFVNINHQNNQICVALTPVSHFIIECLDLMLADYEIINIWTLEELIQQYENSTKKQFCKPCDYDYQSFEKLFTDFDFIFDIGVWQANISLSIKNNFSIFLNETT